MIIHRKPTYRVYVEEGVGVAMAHVAELPGCFTIASTASKAVGLVPAAVRDFLVWLRSHRERLVPEAHVSRPTVADLYVAEVRASSPPTGAGSSAALFESDKIAWDEEKLERALRWLSYSRADLLSAVDGLADRDLRERPIQPDRTLHDTLRHIADAEYGYINRVAGPFDDLEPVTPESPADVRERLLVVRELFERRARAVPLEKRAELIYATWAARPDEPWTLAKALRRALEHELEHVTEIRGR